MASARTIKTLACLVAAMTAVTLLLGWIEPRMVSLRPRPAPAQANSSERPTLLTPLSAAKQSNWGGVELVLAAQGSAPRPDLPATHIIVWPDGRIGRTIWWEQRRPLGPSRTLRICAVYDRRPSDRMLRQWLQACQWAAMQVGLDAATIQLAVTPQTLQNATEAAALPELQRRLHAAMRRSSPGR